jgi:hypothetical protein
MTRNRALRLLALLASLFTIVPIAAGAGAIVLALAGPNPNPGIGIVGLFAMFMTWALLTLLLGNCLIAVWGTASPPSPPPPAEPPVRPVVAAGTTRAELERQRQNMAGAS